MGSAIQVEVTDKKTIKPSSLTPHHLTTSSLSVFDQLIPDVYVPILLFYPSFTSKNTSEISKTLKTSLSEIITHFYPFAGQFQYNDSISCNDHGAMFLEAQVSCPIAKILDNPDHCAILIKQLLPADLQYTTRRGASYLVIVQANFFECGGLALGVSVSHKVADASTVSTFIKSWAAVARASTTTSSIGHDHQEVLPAEVFAAGASLFPPLDILNNPQPAMQFPNYVLTTRRFVFDGSKISALRSKTASSSADNPTRVEAVSALIWKSAMELTTSKFGCRRASTWTQSLNMRKILIRPKAEKLLGNLVGFYTVRAEATEDDDVQNLVATSRKGFENFKANYGDQSVITGEDACAILFPMFGRFINNMDTEHYTCSSWCRFPVYETDFGWGKPAWVRQCVEAKNMLTLMDTKDGKGIEAYFTLDEVDMPIFEKNEELLAYSSSKASVI